MTVLITNNQASQRAKNCISADIELSNKKAPYGIPLNREPQIVELTYDGQKKKN